MNGPIHPVEKAYTATVLVSPMIDGQEKKDQDRARFFEPGQSACVCDGVTSSPYAAQAAELVTSFVPVLFQSNPVETLRMICDLLMALRRESMEADNVSVPEGVPEAMREMLRDIARIKKTDGYQTTMVAAQFSVNHCGVSVRVIRCGDSAMLAFSPDGELFAPSLASVSPYPPASAPVRPDLNQPQQVGGIFFGPGDEILVRIDGPLAAHNELAKITDISPEHIANWIVCTPIQSCPSEQVGVQNPPSSMRLTGNDRLLVPRYLYGRLLTSEGYQYLVLRYSSSIRVVTSDRSVRTIEGFGTGGSSTLVLPDHFYSGIFECFEDAFPPDTQFLLCSDGFYSAFAEWPHMYQWLRGHAPLLSQEDRKAAVLQQLHTRLQTCKGDDDISFIWVYPHTCRTHPGESKHGR